MLRSAGRVIAKLLEVDDGPDDATGDAAAAASAEASRLYQLAYDEARRRLDAQERAVDELRTRAGTLISAATIATSFLGARFVDSGGQPGNSVWIAVAAFATCLFLAVLCILPLAKWSFYFGTRKLIGEYIETDSPLSPPDTMRDLALHLEDDYKANEIRLVRLYKLFAVSVAALVVEVAAWLAHLAGVG